MAIWKNTHASWTVVVDKLGKDPDYVIAPGEIGEIPDQWTPWIIDRGYPLELVRGATPLPTPVQTGDESTAKPPAPAAAPAGDPKPFVAFADEGVQAPVAGVDPKTPVSKRGARLKPSSE